MTVSPMRAGSEPEDNKAELGLDSLTAGETAMAERQAGQSIATLGNENFPQVSLIGALGWQLARRQDPKLRFDTYMSSRKLSEITAELGLSDDSEEEEGKDDGA